MTDRRVLYATAVYDHEEIEAVLGVLDDGAGTLRIDKSVAEMERRVVDLFGKAGGVMCNSGSPRCTSPSSCSTCRQAPRSSPHG